MSAETIAYTSPTLEREDPGVSLRRWTRAEYHRAAELGLFDPDERLELLHGKVYVKLPQSPSHTMGIRAVAETLAAAFGPGYDIRQQLPLILANDGEPEPDVLVVPGSWRDYPDQPTQQDARLPVEVSDTTLLHDRSEKAAQYAEAGILDYWILNLQNRTLEVRREPGELPGAPSGFGYRNVTISLEEETVTPLAKPDTAIRVADLLPPLQRKNSRPKRPSKQRQ